MKLVIEIISNNKRAQAIKDFVFSISQHMQPIESVTVLEEVADAQPVLQQDVAGESQSGDQIGDSSGWLNKGLGLPGSAGTDTEGQERRKRDSEDGALRTVHREKRGTVDPKRSKRK